MQIIAVVVRSAATVEPGPPSAWPDASTTGYSGTLTSRGGLTASAGQTIANQKITGSIRVAVDGVTIRNCWIVSSDYFPIDAEGATNLLVEDCTIEGASNSNACILDSSSASGNVYRRLDISGSQDGIKLSSGSSLVDSYIHDLAPYDPVGDTHNDGCQFGVADGITVDHNTIIMGAGATSAILMGGGESRVRAINCLIQNNYLSGGGYTFYGPAPVSGNVTGGASQNVQVLNNTFTTGWGYGSNTQWEAGIGNVWSGNKTTDGTTVNSAA